VAKATEALTPLGDVVHQVFFVRPARIALRASPQTEGFFLSINFRKIHRLTVTGTRDARHHVQFSVFLVSGDEVSI
jgi:hypothetical protein